MASEAQPVELTAEIAEDLGGIDASVWNRLAGTANPFVRHEFLRALETQGCLGEDAGWEPRHVLLRRDGALVGALPLYAKYHSYGEFVFDWGWADAYERAGLQYYPKLVCAAPFTPATGPRLLFDRDTAPPETGAHLVAAAVEIARQAKVSSVHWLFPAAADLPVLEDAGLLMRAGVQYHWTNPGYRDFQDYLDSLNSKRRKQIRRERRDAAAAPVTVRTVSGNEASEADLEAYHQLYASTYDRKWGYPSLTASFFKEVAETMGDGLVLHLAERDGRCVAGAHLFRGETVLYGRNWGCSEFHPALHFELCYYRSIEYCIERGLASFEAGAQGEHKIFRGFLPVHTHSAHWIRDTRFRAAIEEFLQRERAGVDHHAESMALHSPFKRTSPD